MPNFSMILVVLAVLSLVVFWGFLSVSRHSRDSRKSIKLCLTRREVICLVAVPVLILCSMIYGAAAPTAKQYPTIEIQDSYLDADSEHLHNPGNISVFTPYEDDKWFYLFSIEKDKYSSGENNDIEYLEELSSRLYIVTYPYAEAKSIFEKPAKERTEYYLVVG